MSDTATKPEVQAVPERLSFDIAALTQFLETALSDPVAPISVAKFTGGQSNPTYRLETAQGPMVLRRKPPGKTLASAHAVDREARVMRALGSVGFAVPKILAECEDPGVIGSPFYVMAYLEGRIFWNPLLPDQSPDERRKIFFALTDALAALHAVDIEAAGLSDFGAHSNYYARQIDRWTAQYRAFSEDPLPEMETLSTWLLANIPQDNHIAVVHGDFRLDNVVFHPERPEIIGIIDWELATIGNPLADLSYFLLNWVAPLDVSGRAAIVTADLAALGIPTAEEIADRYFARSTIERPRSFTFHHVYNLFRLAAILHGIAGRSRAGNASSDQASRMGAMVRPAAWLALGLAGLA